MSVRVLEPGLLTTVQDLGRHGHQREGVSVGGAMDGFALRVANSLLGNEEGAAGLEITLGGPSFRFEEAALVAIGGADLGAMVEAVPLPPWRAAWIPRGATLRFPGRVSGCRAYLAVAGGIAVAPVLGSRSTDLRAGIGGMEGRALRGGDLLPRGRAALLGERLGAAVRVREDRTAVAKWGLGRTLRPGYSNRPVVRLVSGPALASLTDASRATLFRTELRVSTRSDRMGYRLEGEPLALSRPLDLLSEAVAFGTVQLPPDGAPIVLMADRQTTGGYPRLGEVATVDLPLLAQLGPGDRVRFRQIALAEAQALHLARERGIAQLRHLLSLRFRGE